MNTLTRREMRLARLVRLGYGNRDIAKSLGKSPQSVKNSISVIYRKLESATGTINVNRAYLASWYVKQNRRTK